ncbi:putative secreted protein [Streptomyces sp. Tu6071]|nr:putative secreted protein [Streptomyces sp. Tu6071]
MLHLDPHARVHAVVRGERGHPRRGVLVTLRLVDVVRDGDELGAGQVVGEGLALRGRPGARARAPRLGERDDVVDVHVRGGGPGGAVVRGLPGARGRGAAGVLRDVRAVTFQHDLAGVATAGLRDPVRELVAAVTAHRPGRRDAQLGEVTPCRGGGDGGGRGRLRGRPREDGGGGERGGQGAERAEDTAGAAARGAVVTRVENGRTVLV